MKCKLKLLVILFCLISFIAGYFYSTYNRKISASPEKVADAIYASGFDVSPKIINYELVVKEVWNQAERQIIKNDKSIQIVVEGRSIVLKMEDIDGLKKTYLVGAPFSGIIETEIQGNSVVWATFRPWYSYEYHSTILIELVSRESSDIWRK